MILEMDLSTALGRLGFDPKTLGFDPIETCQFEAYLGVKGNPKGLVYVYHEKDKQKYAKYMSGFTDLFDYKVGYTSLEQLKEKKTPKGVDILILTDTVLLDPGLWKLIQGPFLPIVCYSQINLQIRYQDKVVCFPSGIEKTSGLMDESIQVCLEVLPKDYPPFHRTCAYARQVIEFQLYGDKEKKLDLMKRGAKEGRKELVDKVRDGKMHDTDTSTYCFIETPETACHLIFPTVIVFKGDWTWQQKISLCAARYKFMVALDHVIHDSDGVYMGEKEELTTVKLASMDEVKKAAMAQLIKDIDGIIGADKFNAVAEQMSVPQQSREIKDIMTKAITRTEDKIKTKCANPACCKSAAVKKCPCGVHYCSKECQWAHWSVHKTEAEHPKSKG